MPPYSQYDLVLLDLLNEALGNLATSIRQLSTPIYVANLQEYRSIEQLTEDIPTVTQVPPQTPVAAKWEDGILIASAWGKRGRALAAVALGLSPEKIEEQMLARIPTYPAPMRRAT